MSDAVLNNGFPYRIEAKGAHGKNWGLAYQCRSLEEGEQMLAEYQARAGQPVPGHEGQVYFPFVRLTDDRRREVDLTPRLTEREDAPNGLTG